MPAVIAITFGVFCGYARDACDVSVAGVVASGVMSAGGIPYWIWSKRRGYPTRGAKYLVFVGATPVLLLALIFAVIIGGK